MFLMLGFNHIQEEQNIIKIIKVMQWNLNIQYRKTKKTIFLDLKILAHQARL